VTHLKRSALALGAAIALCAQIPSRAQSADAVPASTRLAMPGDKHQWLAPLAGKWNVEMLVWPAPGAQPITSKDLTATREWILGGRYLVENLIGTFAGNPSHRVATLGYNNLEERFELSTIDTFEPGQMWYRSSSIGNARKIAMTGENTEAGFSAKPTGRKRDLRFEFEIAADSNVQKIYVKYPGEAEYLFVEQRFTRMK
jgi:Protein of unknown function (DUF1579)